MRARSTFLLALIGTWAASPGVRAEPAAASARVAPALAEIDLALARGEAGPLHQRLAAAAGDDAVGAFLAAYSVPDREDAWKELKARSEKHAAEPWPYVGEALILAGWRTWDQADRVIALAAQRAPEESLVQIVQARVMAAMDRKAEARAILEKILHDDPSSAPAHAALGAVLLASGDKQEARRELSAAVAAEPRDLASTEALASVCADLGDGSCALAQLESAVKMTPADVALEQQLGQARQKAGDAAGAARAYLAGKVLETGNEATLKPAVQAFHDSGDGEHELAGLVRLDRLAPRNVDTLRRIAELRLASGTGDVARAYAALLEVAPEDGPANLAVASASEKSGDLVKAAQSYKRASAGGSAQATEALAALAKRVQAAHAPFDGKASVNRVASLTLSSVAHLAAELRKKTPHLYGKVVAKVTVDKEGKASDVEILENTTKDASVAACVYLNLLDASYPPKKPNDYRLEIPVK